jgi:hypothetical protein
MLHVSLFVRSLVHVLVIADKIRVLAATWKIGEKSLTPLEVPAATCILADGQRVLAVHDEDAAFLAPKPAAVRLCAGVKAGSLRVHHGPSTTGERKLKTTCENLF